MIANGKLLVHGAFNPSTKSARQVIDLARSGFRFQASVGIMPLECDQVRAVATVEVNRQAVQSQASGFPLARAGI